MPNKHKMGAKSRNRRRRSLLRSQGPVCFYCEKIFPEEELTLDHKKPISKGGLNSLNNLVLACSKCNAKKANKEANPGEFA